MCNNHLNVKFLYLLEINRNIPLFLLKMMPDLQNVALFLLFPICAISTISG